jgi:glycolate oxidase FAD binding subunit
MASTRWKRPASSPANEPALRCPRFSDGPRSPNAKTISRSSLSRMSNHITPTTVSELVSAVRDHPRLLAVGAQTKPRLSAIDDDVMRLSTLKLSGITEYEPDEYTFTALAGTPVREIAEAVAAKGQYLPFDPLLLEAGSTIGGAVASGLSGPGRFRFGGLRDFILGVRFVDGSARELRLGGKVVKNAAGFDLPKFFVGSLGRFGVFAEFTFKVFPSAAATLTLRLPVSDPTKALEIFDTVGLSRWEAEAVDFLPTGDAVLVRLAGPDEPLQILAQEIFRHFPGEILSATAADTIWSDLRELRWTTAENSLHKVAISPNQVPALCIRVSSLSGDAHIYSGGNVALVSLPAGTDATSLGLPALTLRGTGPLWTLPPTPPAIHQAVKLALDPADRFPSLA